MHRLHWVKRHYLKQRLTHLSQAVNLNHFRLLRVVGKGAFGKVRIVERKDTGLTFALKYIRKDEGEQTRGPICLHPSCLRGLQWCGQKACGTSSESGGCWST